MSSPKVPSTPAPQAVQQPDMTALLRGQSRRASSATGGTLLTSATGIAPGALSTGNATLLGG